MDTAESRAARQRRHVRVRNKVEGTAARPRLCVYRSLKHISAQIIDDDAGRTLVSADSREKSFTTRPGRNRQAAKELGKLVAQRSLENGVSSVIFDRNGFRYHGRVQALAEAAREEGLKF